MSEPQWDGALTNLEAKADTESLEYLQQVRRQLLPEYSALRALHGNGSRGIWDAKRKSLVEALKIKARMACDQKNVKPTEGLIDAMAHGEQQYIDFIDQGIDSATRYVVLEIQVQEINERIENRNAALYFAGQELRMTR